MRKRILRRLQRRVLTNSLQSSFKMPIYSACLENETIYLVLVSKYTNISSGCQDKLRFSRMIGNINGKWSENWFWKNFIKIPTYIVLVRKICYHSWCISQNFSKSVEKPIDRIINFFKHGPLLAGGSKPTL